MAERVDISLAGRVVLGGSGRESTAAALGCRARVALAYLVLERWRPVAADELAEAVWGVELPATWRAALRGVIARLRGALNAAGLNAAEVLTSGSGGYQLNLPPGSTVDIEVAEAFLRSAGEDLADEPQRACAAARRAVATLRGEFLAASDGAWVERRRAELSELHLQALETLAQAATACGDSDSALRAAVAAVALEPLRESAHRRVMAAHEAAGNRGAALQAYERCERLLAEELGVGPAAQTRAAHAALHVEEPRQTRTGSARRVGGNLPVPISRFVGRVGERAQIQELLRSTRLITLTGSGGLGKSRLGLEVAGDVGSDYPDGVWLVELAGLAKSDLLAEQVMADVGAPNAPGSTATQALTAHLTGWRSLLVLDNCEHLVSACASLVDCLLKSCAGLDIMVTSREPLCVTGETVWVVGPLSTPREDDPAELEPLLRHDAVALFVDRARAVAPGLDLGPSADDVATICRRLEGIPLALELAAARVRSMAVPDIADRLRHPLSLLDAGSRTAPPRHQTLRAAMEWSYEALSDTERRLFARVSVFAGDFSLEAAEAVCPREARTTLDTLSRLVDKSLVLADRAGSCSRYRLLEIMRQYGHEVLAGAGLELETRRSQLDWAATLAETAEAGLDGPELPRWLQVLDAEHDNLRGALDWAASHPEDLGGPRTAAALWRYWQMRGFLNEGRSRLETVLDADVPVPLRAKILTSAGVLAQSQGDQGSARGLYAQALELRRSLDDRLGMAAALNGLGNVAVSQGDLAGARDIFEHNLVTSRELGDPRMIAASLMNLGVVVQLLFVSGRTALFKGAAEAHVLYLESLHRYRELGDSRGVAQSLENLGVLAPYRGEDNAARAYLEESLAVRRELQDRSGTAAAARFLGQLALRSRDYPVARCLHEECLAIELDLGNQLLVVADLASLAEIAHGEGDDAEARRLVGRALAVSDELGETGAAAALRLRLAAIMPKARRLPVGHLGHST